MLEFVVVVEVFVVVVVEDVVVVVVNGLNYQLYRG